MEICLFNEAVIDNGSKSIGPIKFGTETIVNGKETTVRGYIEGEVQVGPYHGQHRIWVDLESTTPEVNVFKNYAEDAVTKGKQELNNFYHYWVLGERGWKKDE